MSTRVSHVVLALIATCGAATVVRAHCEVPCGIYADKARVDALYEDAATIEKAMGQIAALAGKADPLSANQLVRWVQTKEEHACRVQEVAWQYFMTQRIKPATSEAEQAKYVAQLTAAHEILRAAMKTKQTVDTANVGALRRAIDALAASYFSAEVLEHIRAEHGEHSGK